MIFVILAHESPELLRKVLLKLKHKNNYFVIHIDKQSNIQPFLNLTEDIENCYFTPERYQTEWGTFSLVAATLHAFDFIRGSIRKRQRIVLLSGSDYPIKPIKFINNYLKSHKDTIFFEYDRIPRKVWSEGGRKRFPLYDSIKEQISLFGGSQWFSIPPKVLPIIFDFLKLNPDFIEYYKFVKIPDESFFQTLFLNCDHPYVINNLRNVGLHYIKWVAPYQHPTILTIRDFEELKNSKYLFARKLNLAYSEELIDQFDKIQPNSMRRKAFLR